MKTIDEIPMLELCHNRLAKKELKRRLKQSAIEDIKELNNQRCRLQIDPTKKLSRRYFTQIEHIKHTIAYIKQKFNITEEDLKEPKKIRTFIGDPVEILDNDYYIEFSDSKKVKRRFERR